MCVFIALEQPIANWNSIPEDNRLDMIKYFNPEFNKLLKGQKIKDSTGDVLLVMG